MIAWMSDKTSDFCDGMRLSVYGFDMVKDQKDAHVMVEKCDTTFDIALGDVSGKTYEEIDSMFIEAVKAEIPELDEQGTGFFREVA